MREFNVTGLCLPNQHYMVDISNKVSQIVAMVEKGQYGKTTTIRQLEKVLLEKDYQVARISFEGVAILHLRTRAIFSPLILESGERKSPAQNGLGRAKKGFMTA